MTNIPSNLTTMIETAQIKNAATKHNHQFLQFNLACQTLDLYTLNLSGSYLRTPIGNFHLHSVQRLTYTAPYNKEDIIYITFYQGTRLKVATMPLQVFYTPQKLVSRLQSIGIVFTTPLPPSQLGKYLADYLGQNMTFKTIAALPGWEHFPTPDDELHFLLPDTVSNEVLASPLQDLKVNWEPTLSSEDLDKVFHYKKTYDYPDELIVLSVIHLNALLRTLFIKYERNFEFIVNIIPEKNSIETQHILQQILSLYKNPGIYRLPMPNAELEKIITEKRDDCIFFTVPHTKLNQYQRMLLSENLDKLLYYQQTYAFIPIVFSDGYLDVSNSDNILSFPINNEILSGINRKSLSAFGNLSVEFIKFIDKNKNVMNNTYFKASYDNNHSYDNIRNGLILTYDIFEKFLLINLKASNFIHIARSNTIHGKIAGFFNRLENSTQILGLSEIFIEKLQNKIMDGSLALQDNSVVWDPETMSESVMLTDGIHICMDPILFDNLVAQTFSQVPALTVLQSLVNDGYLTIDSSGQQQHYKKKTRYTSPDHKIVFRRFVVFKQNLLNLPNGPRLI